MEECLKLEAVCFYFLVESLFFSIVSEFFVSVARVVFLTGSSDFGFSVALLLVFDDSVFTFAGFVLTFELELSFFISFGLSVLVAFTGALVAGGGGGGDDVGDGDEGGFEGGFEVVVVVVLLVVEVVVVVVVVERAFGFGFDVVASAAGFCVVDVWGGLGVVVGFGVAFCAVGFGVAVVGFAVAFCAGGLAFVGFASTLTFGVPVTVITGSSFLCCFTFDGFVLSVKSGNACFNGTLMTYSFQGEPSHTYPLCM